MMLAHQVSQLCKITVEGFEGSFDYRRSGIISAESASKREDIHFWSSSREGARVSYPRLQALQMRAHKLHLGDDGGMIFMVDLLRQDCASVHSGFAESEDITDAKSQSHSIVWQAFGRVLGLVSRTAKSMWQGRLEACSIGSCFDNISDSAKV